MLVDLQGNIGASISNPIQYSFDDLIFCNIGGKENMSLLYKNIPPMEQNDIPSEIQIKNKSGENVFKKIQSYDKSCQLNLLCTDEIPFFRFQVIYDGYDFIYYPEFKLYERPSLLLDSNVSSGTNILVFNKSLNETKDLNYLESGVTIYFKDYDTEYTIQNVVETTQLYTLTLDRDLEENYYKNDLVIFNNLKYELQSKSNILTDSTVNDLSPFKFKFINTYNSKSWYMNESLGKANAYTLINNNYTDIVDLWGDDKIVSLSNNIDIEDSTTISLNINLNTTDTILELTSAPTIPIDLYSYITVKSNSGLEILKVTEINSTVNFTVERAQLNTSLLDHNSVDAVLYFAKNIYFVLLPYNKELSKRYVYYRNIDLTLHQV